MLACVMRTEGAGQTVLCLITSLPCSYHHSCLSRRGSVLGNIRLARWVSSAVPSRWDTQPCFQEAPGLVGRDRETVYIFISQPKIRGKQKFSLPLSPQTAALLLVCLNIHEEVLMPTEANTNTESDSSLPRRSCIPIPTTLGADTGIRDSSVFLNLILMLPVLHTNSHVTLHWIAACILCSN